MATMTLTLIGMYNYDNTLFDLLTLPDGIDKELFVNSLLMKSGEFETLYPDVDFMKQFIKVWGDKWNHTFSEWLKGQNATWNPIENYDRYEDSEDKHISSGTSSGSDNFNSTGSNEAKVSAYDSSSYQPSGLNETGTQSNSTTNTSTSGSGTDTHTSHIHGNIGVTQSADMLRNFYDIASWNLYDHMSDVFIMECLIPVY